MNISNSVCGRIIDELVEEIRDLSEQVNRLKQGQNSSNAVRRTYEEVWDNEADEDWAEY
jgi:hypothetical protein